MAPGGKIKAFAKWSMHQALHSEVSNLLVESGLEFRFHSEDSEVGCINDRDTNIMGRFTCHTSTCGSNGWSSQKIAITIREYSGQRYNARVYHQRCRSCKRLSRPLLDYSYAERVVYWLKKWSGVQVVKPAISGHSKGPHDSSLCEGCKAGHCSQEDNDFFSGRFNRFVSSESSAIDWLMQA
ncbi:unnamed protein product [Penicillium salamii]|uniref:3CxxC-type domain-containing protein n=1 Tax=Penicillium salamii TaxID=1612424 RepID=A0A9W4J943_9EURO|nr:unnamed protein product [Penicillium salamii]CAG8385661.1 unnamed protein product [Penicillium salamii]CAG8407654.1 unnamed protein product [Penicillium salamii]